MKRLSLTVCAFLVAASGAFAQTPTGPVQWSQINGAVGHITAAVATGTAATDVANLQAAMNAVPSAGGVVVIPAGVYATNAAISIKSNTHIRFVRGAVIRPIVDLAASSGAFVNVNKAAGSITDHDIVIEDFAIDFSGRPADGGWHAIYMRMAKTIRIERPHCFGGGGGDCTAMVATDDTIVRGGSSTGTINACWDHWEAPTSAMVVNNYCEHPGYGLLFTGTNTVGTSSQVASRGQFSGNIFVAQGSQAAIWVNGIGTAGSGANNVTIENNIVDMNGISALTCIKASGASTDIGIRNNLCRNSGTNSMGIITSVDSGGTPSKVSISGNIIDGVQVTSGNIAPLSVNSNDSVVYANRIINTGGNYVSAIRFSAANIVAFANVADAGSGTKYNVTGATALSNTDIDSTTGAFGFLNGSLGIGLSPGVGSGFYVKEGNTGVINFGQIGGNSTLACFNFAQAVTQNALSNYSMCGDGNNTLLGAPTGGFISMRVANTSVAQASLKGFQVVTYTVAALPSVAAGDNGTLAFASNCRQTGEGAAAGTGCIVYVDKNGVWKAMWSGVAPTT